MNERQQDMSRGRKADAIVIGSGIIGVMAAHYLQDDGRSVLLIERGEVAKGASFGNAGILAYPEIIPIAAPDMLMKVPKWLLDPLGPLSLPPSYALQIAPWLWRFWRASARSVFNRGLQVQIGMMRLAATEMSHVIEAAGLSALVRNTGTLDLYDSEGSFNASKADWNQKAGAGINFSPVGRNEIDLLQPGLAPRFQHAMFTPGGLQVSDPYDFTKAIADRVQARGGTLHRGEVVRIEPQISGARVCLADGQIFEGTTVVVAGGAWSKGLASGLGDRLPLETERGYNTTLPSGAFALERQLYFNDHGFVVTPLSSGVRVGGAVELGGLTMPPNYRRSAAMLEKAKIFLAELNTNGGKQWMGFRPSMPDCLPVIGRSTASPSVIYAFGHGHLGLTQSAATGRLVSDLVAGRTSTIALDPFRPTRF